MDSRAFPDLIRVSDSVEEKITLTIASIIDVAVKLGLSNDAVEAALGIYEDLAKKCTFKGKSTRALSAAIVYAACKRINKACGLHEIARITGVKSNKIFCCHRFILENLGYGIHPPSIEGYITRICEKLALSTSTTDTVKKIAMGARNHAQIRGATSSIVAASIYIASAINGERRTQREIADITGTTETTIRSKCKEIMSKLQVILKI